ncbi:MAG: metal ABC transporter permease [Gallionella sp.]|nr:metal ABC transporter permease [Gallionella sp.]
MNTVELNILIPAFIAGMLILVTHIPLGMKVLQRGIIFADLAVAQIAGLGIVIAGLFGMTEHPVAVQGIAVSSALLGAGLLAYTEHRHAETQEAIIGLLFVLAASGSVLLLSSDTHSGEHLKDLLIGQILWVNSTQLIATACLSAALLLTWPLLKRYLGSLGFYAAFALAVTASVQLAGIYLVFASLIVPALATLRCGHNRLALAFLVGLSGYALGLLCSVWLDLPAGAAIVWAMSACGAAVALWQRA